MDESTFRAVATSREEFFSARDRLATRERKKLDERLTLEKVYWDQRFFCVDWRERPDFALRQHPSHHSFGVEVCRFFDSEAAARLSEFDGYSQALLSGGPKRHKDDVKGFNVAPVGIIDDQGRTIDTDIPAIVRQLPTMASVVDSLRLQVEAKERSFPLDDVLRHVNLIVDDRSGAFAATESKELYRYIAPGMSSTILQSRFREIYFITRLKSGPSYVPLKMLMTLARLHFAFDALAAMVNDGHGTQENHMTVFAEHIAGLTDQRVGIRRDKHTVEVLFGDTGFIAQEEGDGAMHTTVRMYRDAEWPSCETVSRASSLFASELCLETSRLMSTSTFVSEIAFPVRIFEAPSH